MARLDSNKPMLLRQLKNNPNPSIPQLVKLLNMYEDLTIDDLKSLYDITIIAQVEDARRDPAEKALYEDIEMQMKTLPNDVASLQEMLNKANRYQSTYPSAPGVGKMRDYSTQLRSAIDVIRENERLAEEMKREQERIEAERQREQSKWAALDRSSYGAMQGYKSQFPDSVHLAELEDMMWDLTKRQLNYTTINRFLNDWTDWGKARHIREANDAIDRLMEWDNIRQKGDIIQVAKYYSSIKGTALDREVNRKFQELKQRELENMRTNSADYDLYRINQLFDAGVFTKWELIDANLMTEESFDILKEVDTSREALQSLAEFQREDPDITAPEGCTDIYLFGTPGTGKTCLLMGLAGANGMGYALNMRMAGGPYASALQEYVNAGITPGRTFGQFVTVINGTVTNEIRRGGLFGGSTTTVEHPINLVEMSGEEFALRIADNKSVSLADMGTGATKLLCNNNRKVFFIIVDCSKDRIKVETVQDIKDENGNVVDQVIRKRYISQLDILNKFVGLFSIEANQKMMKNVDSIHFVVTKSDLLAAHPQERQEQAVKLLQEKYLGPIENLKQYCRRTKRINYATGYRPHVFTFSLGNFYLGDVFTFNRNDTLEIVEAIRAVTSGRKERGFLDRLKEKLG